MSIREEVGKILGVYIEPGRWDEEFRMLDKIGAFTSKTQMQILLVILKKLDEYEKTGKNPTV
jgi:hypothetical protein